MSARVNKYIYNEYKKSEVPISTIIEAGLIYFLKMDDDEKIKFLADNLPESAEKEDIQPLKTKWNDLLIDMLKKINIPGTVAASIIAGPLIGPISIIAGVYLSKVLKNDNKKNLRRKGIDGKQI